MVYGYIKDEYNNMDFINLQKEALNDFSSVYDYSIDEIIIETEGTMQLENLMDLMKKGDKLVTCGCSTYSLGKDRFYSLLDKLESNKVKIIFVQKPVEILIHEINLCLKRINNRKEIS